MNTAWLWHMFEVTRTRSGVPIRVHWSVPAVALFLLGTGVRHIFTATAFIISYLLMLVVHELGHQFAAHWRHCRVFAIAIYPLHATCRHEEPYSQLDDALIAWGGPAAQLLVAAPLAAWIALVGSTHVDALDVVIAFLGVFSPFIALFNLLPIAPLDGRKAWMILPIAWERITHRKKPRRPLTALEALEEAVRKASASSHQKEQPKRETES